MSDLKVASSCSLKKIIRLFYDTVTTSRCIIFFDEFVHVAGVGQWRI